MGNCYLATNNFQLLVLYLNFLSSSISLVASLSVLVFYFFFHHGLFPSKSKKTEDTALIKIITGLSFCDFLASLFICISSGWIIFGDGSISMFYCSLFRVCIQMAFLCSFGFTSGIAFLIYRETQQYSVDATPSLFTSDLNSQRLLGNELLSEDMIEKDQAIDKHIQHLQNELSSQKKTKKRNQHRPMYSFMLLFLLLPLCLVFCLILFNQLQRGQPGWCHPKKIFHLLTWYLPLLICFVMNSIFYYLASKNVKRIFQRFSSEGRYLRNSLSRKVLLYLLVFLVCWIWSILDMVNSTFSPQCPWRWLWIIQDVITPLQGFFNMFIYAAANGIVRFEMCSLRPIYETASNEHINQNEVSSFPGEVKINKESYLFKTQIHYDYESDPDN